MARRAYHFAMGLLVVVFGCLSIMFIMELLTQERERQGFEDFVKEIDAVTEAEPQGNADSAASRLAKHPGAPADPLDFEEANAQSLEPEQGGVGETASEPNGALECINGSEQSASASAGFNIGSALLTSLSKTKASIQEGIAALTASAGLASAAPQSAGECLEGERLSQGARLHPDLFGWVCIEGTALNYPVMHTPDDPEFYLHRDLDGNYSYSGVPFLAGGCFEGCGNYILYGHHMKNGTMFKTVTYYAEQSFYREHPLITFNTTTRPGVYEVFAAFYGDVGDGPDSFRYYDYVDLRDPAVFQEYVQKVKELSLYPAGPEPVYGEELLTLSTCSYHTDLGRFIVVAKRVE